MQPKWPLYALPSCPPKVGLTLESMSSTIPLTGRRAWTRSIQHPDRSASAERLASWVSTSVSKRPIWLVEAACPVTAWPPTTQRIAGSCASRSASFTSSYPAKRPNTDWRNCPTREWRPFAPVRVSVRHLSSGLAQTKGIVEFAAGQQTTIGRDLRSVELQLETAVERQPKINTLRFTRRRFHSRYPLPTVSC